MLFRKSKQNAINTLMHRIVIALWVVCMTACTPFTFSKANIRSDIEKLASPAFLGRSLFGEGEARSIAFLSRRMSELGMQPLAGAKDFFHPVPLLQIKTETMAQVRLGDIELSVDTDITIASESDAPFISLTNTPVVFVGFGIHAPEKDWDDYHHVDVKGKIVIAYVNDPGGFYGSTAFDGKTMTTYSRIKHKYDEARKRGAIGVFIVFDEKLAGYPWHVITSRKDGKFFLDRGETGSNPLKVMGWLKESSLEKIIATEKRSLQNIKASGMRDAQFNLPSSPFFASVANTVTRATSQNVCGMLPSAKTSERYAIVSAHWDHLGPSPNFESSSEVFGGAIDNGTGVAAMLEVARFARTHRPLSTNLLFCSFTAEEQGLLGAQHFIASKPAIIERTDYVINFDCMNVGSHRQEGVVYGDWQWPIAQSAMNAMRKQQRTPIKDPMDDKGYFFRSDHHPFVVENIQALLFLDIGYSNPDYLQSHYHQISDRFDPSWPLDGMIDDLDVVKDVIVVMDNAGRKTS